MRMSGDDVRVGDQMTGGFGGGCERAQKEILVGNFVDWSGDRLWSQADGQ